MTPEEQRYYDNFFDMFSSDGWKQLSEELEVRKDTYNINQLKNEQDLYKVQGELAIIEMILNFPNFVESGFEALNNNE